MAKRLQAARNICLYCIKLFLASLDGGLSIIQALSSDLRNTWCKSMDEVHPANPNECLCRPPTLTGGGSWPTPEVVTKRGDFTAITKLAKDAIALAQT